MNAHFVVLLLILSKIQCEEKVRIGLPEFICDKDGGIRDISRDVTTLRLLGPNTQNVTYKFDINFQNLGKKCQNNQRCTLLMWKAIRDLEKYLKNYPKTKSKNGLIEINNTMLSPGVKYIINVTIINQDRVISEKQLTLDYVDDVVRNKIKKPMASLILLGAETAYAFSPYVINADVNLCSNLSSYYFKWNVQTEGSVNIFVTKNGQLNIPANTFQAPKTYSIKCELRENEDSVIAQSEQELKILSKGFLVILPIKKITSSVNQEIPIQVFLKDLDNTEGDFEISWYCSNVEDGTECEFKGNSNDVENFPPITTKGIYNITLEAKKNSQIKSDFLIIEIVDNVPLVEIADFDIPTNSLQGFQIQTKIYNLQSSCTIQWTSPDGTDFESLDLTKMSGMSNVINVTMKEDIFLQELDEFTNSTLDKRHDLVITPSRDIKGDVTYLFRLIAICPKFDENYDDLDNANDVIETNTDVIVVTNAPPLAEKLEVSPVEGVAFLTSFKFGTDDIADNDGPVLYKFGYIFQKRDVVLWTSSGVPNCEGTLPFSENGIQTFVETCDGFGACGRFLGPLVKTTLPKIEMDKIFIRFVSKLNNEDYFEAFVEAFIIQFSFKDQQKEARDYISEKINEELDKFLKKDNSEQTKRSALSLIENINEFHTDLQLPEHIINKVLELRNKLSDSAEKHTQRNLLSYRQKRASYLALNDVKNYLQTSELIITTSNDPNKVKLERENLLKQLGFYMEKLCANVKKSQQSLQLQTVIFSVEKLKRNSLNNFLTIPFEPNAWQTYGRIKLGNVVKDSKDKCVGKAILKDYFERNGVTYFVDVLNVDKIDASEIVLYLPKNKSIDGAPRCFVHYESTNSECKIAQNIANYVKCVCKHLGYFYLEYTTTQSTTVATTIKIETTLITFNLSENSSRLRDSTTSNAYDTISYIVIGGSVFGIIVLAIILRKMFHEDDEENEDSDTLDFPKYAQLHDEEFLTDAHM